MFILAQGCSSELDCHNIKSRIEHPIVHVPRKEVNFTMHFSLQLLLPVLVKPSPSHVLLLGVGPLSGE